MDPALRWMSEQVCGSQGSDQNLAYRLRLALNPFTLFGISVGSEKDRQWAIKLLSRAFQDLDGEFFRKVTDGVKALKANDPNQSLEVRYFFFYVYDFLRRNAASEPTLLEVRVLTKRIWAITRLTGRRPSLPLPSYRPTFEAKISAEIERMPKQKWSRHSKALGLHLPPAKRGRKRANSGRKI